MGYAWGELLSGGEEADEDSGHSKQVKPKQDIAGYFHTFILNLYLFVISSSWFWG